MYLKSMNKRGNVFCVRTMLHCQEEHGTFISAERVEKYFFIRCTYRRIVRSLKQEVKYMPVNSKQKGARFERYLASIFREFGYNKARRTAQYCGNTGDASDVVGLPYIHVEAKHQEQMRLYDWMDQAKRDAAATDKFLLPAVFHKKNNHNILVTMELEDWMQIYREYESGMSLDYSGKDAAQDGHEEVMQSAT